MLFEFVSRRSPFLQKTILLRSTMTSALFLPPSRSLSPFDRFNEGWKVVLARKSSRISWVRAMFTGEDIGISKIPTTMWPATSLHSKEIPRNCGQISSFLSLSFDSLTEFAEISRMIGYLFFFYCHLDIDLIRCRILYFLRKNKLLEWDNIWNFQNSRILISNENLYRLLRETIFLSTRNFFEKINYSKKLNFEYFVILKQSNMNTLMKIKFLFFYSNYSRQSKIVYVTFIFFII